MKFNYINLKRGFTIAEIVVVVGIMALLTTLIYASLDSSKKQSRDQKRVADISSVQLALEQFYNINKRYPPMLDNTSSPENGLLPKYLTSIPSSDIIYVPLKNTMSATYCGSYHLYVMLESKISILSSKKGFNSIPSTVIKCAGGTPVDASSTELIYDVTP